MRHVVSKPYKFVCSLLLILLLSLFFIQHFHGNVNNKLYCIKIHKFTHADHDKQDDITVYMTHNVCKTTKTKILFRAYCVSKLLHVVPQIPLLLWLVSSTSDYQSTADDGIIQLWQQVFSKIYNIMPTPCQEYWLCKSKIRSAYSVQGTLLCHTILGAHFLISDHDYADVATCNREVCTL